MVNSIIEDGVNEKLTIALAHEVKNPVALIKANIELLELQGTFNSNEQNVAIIKKELNKISQIVTDFTILCGANNNIQDLYELDLFDIIEEVEEDYRVTNYFNNISFYLNCFCKPEERFIKGSEVKFNMLFCNIYKNAIEALKEEDNNINHVIKTNIYISREKVNNKLKEKLVVEVIDSGHGIKKEIENNIGEAFNTTKSNGTGLGLAICKNIVNELGGKFSIDNNSKFNKYNKGCIVKIEFDK